MESKEETSMNNNRPTDYDRLMKALSCLKGQKAFYVDEDRMLSLLDNEFRNDPDIKRIRIEYVPNTRWRIIPDRFNWYNVELIKYSNTKSYDVVFEYSMVKYTIAGIEDTMKGKVINIGSTSLLPE